MLDSYLVHNFVETTVDIVRVVEYDMYTYLSSQNCVSLNEKWECPFREVGLRVNEIHNEMLWCTISRS